MYVVTQFNVLTEEQNWTKSFKREEFYLDNGKNLKHKLKLNQVMKFQPPDSWGAVLKLG